MAGCTPADGPEAGRRHRRPDRPLRRRRRSRRRRTRRGSRSTGQPRAAPPPKGKRLLVEGQTDAAVREMREAVKADPSRAQAYVDLARALMQKPEGATAAQEALITAIRTMGESPRLMVMLGQVYFRRGAARRRGGPVTKALSDAKSKNPDARLELGIVYREKKDYPKSVEQLTRASQEFIGQGSRIAEALTELGRTYEVQGDRTRADESFRRALDTDPQRRRHLLLLRPLPRRGPSHAGEGPGRRGEVPRARAAWGSRRRRAGARPLRLPATPARFRRRFPGAGDRTSGTGRLPPGTGTAARPLKRAPGRGKRGASDDRPCPAQAGVSRRGPRCRSPSHASPASCSARSPAACGSLRVSSRWLGGWPRCSGPRGRWARPTR